MAGFENTNIRLNTEDDNLLVKEIIEKNVIVSTEQKSDLAIWYSLVNNGYDILKQIDEAAEAGFNVLDNTVIAHDNSITFEEQVSSLLAFSQDTENRKKRFLDWEENEINKKLGESHYLCEANHIKYSYELKNKYYRKAFKNIISMNGGLQTKKRVDRYTKNIVSLMRRIQSIELFLSVDKNGCQVPIINGKFFSNWEEYIKSSNQEYEDINNNDNNNNSCRRRDYDEIEPKDLDDDWISEHQKHKKRIRSTKRREK
jgi:hypothetical protein